MTPRETLLQWLPNAASVAAAAFLACRTELLSDALKQVVATAAATALLVSLIGALGPLLAS